MKVRYQPDYEVSSAAAKSATGRSLEEWFAEFDSKGEPGQGRKALGDYLLKEMKVDAWWTGTLVVEYEKARGKVERDGLAKGYNICVTKSVGAAVMKVYEALLDTGAWMGADASAELREGGGFSDGDGHCGVFRRLTPGKLMRFSWEGQGHQPGEEVEVKLSEAGGKSSILLTHSRLLDRAAADGMRRAWGRVLDIVKERAA